MINYTTDLTQLLPVIACSHFFYVCIYIYFYKFIACINLYYHNYNQDTEWFHYQKRAPWRHTFKLPTLCSAHRYQGYGSPCALLVRLERSASPILFCPVKVNWGLGVQGQISWCWLQPLHTDPPWRGSSCNFLTERYIETADMVLPRWGLDQHPEIQHHGQIQIPGWQKGL